MTLDSNHCVPYRFNKEEKAPPQPSILDPWTWLKVCIARVDSVAFTKARWLLCFEVRNHGYDVNTIDLLTSARCVANACAFNLLSVVFLL